MSDGIPSKTDVFAQLGVLSEPTRARILRVLCREELAVGELARVLQVPQPTVSRHLKHLARAGWVERRKVGTASWYRARIDTVPAPARTLWTVVDQELETAAANVASVHAEDLRRLQTILDQRADDSATLFAQLGSRWDGVRVEQFGQQWLAPLALAFLDGDGLTIGDLGCGTGHLLPALSATGARVVGIDREQAMLEVARQRVDALPKVDVIQGLLDDLPLDDSSLDLGVCAFVLHHIKQPAPVFAELRRVLKNGGRVVLLDMVAHDREDYRRTMRHVHRGFSEAAVRGLADAAGLSLLSYRPLPPDPVAQGPGLFVAALS